MFSSFSLPNAAKHATQRCAELSHRSAAFSVDFRDLTDAEKQARISRTSEKSRGPFSIVQRGIEPTTFSCTLKIETSNVQTVQGRCRLN